MLIGKYFILFVFVVLGSGAIFNASLRYAESFPQEGEIGGLILSAAFFVLFPAAAGAGLVATDFFAYGPHTL